MNIIKHHFFPGGNTPRGFYSFYENILLPNESGRLFCIKGGPGTGKSTLMKDIGIYFEDKGMDMDYLWCSSDPDSLDGIVIKQLNMAIVDGTAPHVVDPKNPGAIDEIVNLGECWDEELLIDRKNQIVDLNLKISNCYSKCYYHLNAASEKLKIIEDNIIITNEYEILKQMDQILLSVDSNKNYELKSKSYFGSAITYKGIINKLDEMRSNVKLTIVLNTPIGLRIDHILENISDKLATKGGSIKKLYCPMNPKKLEHIIADDESLAIFTTNEYHNSYNAGENETIALNIEYKFLDKSMYDKNIVEFEKCISDAKECLAEAKMLHDLLEEYYIPAMNFDMVNEIKGKIISKIESISY